MLGLKSLDELIRFDIKKLGVLYLVARDSSSGKNTLEIECPLYFPYLDLHIFENTEVVGDQLTFYGRDFSVERFSQGDQILRTMG